MLELTDFIDVRICSGRLDGIKYDFTLCKGPQVHDRKVRKKSIDIGKVSIWQRTV